MYVTKSFGVPTIIECWDSKIYFSSIQYFYKENSSNSLSPRTLREWSL